MNDVIFDVRGAWNDPDDGGDVLDEHRAAGDRGRGDCRAVGTRAACRAARAAARRRRRRGSVWRLVTAFLVGYPPHSSRAYFSDLRAWWSWCAAAGVHPLTARRHHVDIWVRHLSQEPQSVTGRPASPASIARRLSCLSQFYDYGIKDAELLEHSPVGNVRRPKVSDDPRPSG